VNAYTIGTQFSYDEALVLGDPVAFGAGKWIWNTAAAAAAFIREEHEPWHRWCAVYEVRLSGRVKLRPAKADLGLNAPRELATGRGRTLRRVWPTRKHVIWSPLP